MPELDRRSIILGAGIVLGTVGSSFVPAAPVQADPLDDTVDLALLRRTFTLAAEARQVGGAPYGALVAGADGVVVAEQRNISALPGGDPTQHAELVAVANAWKTIGEAGMNSATLYASTEPCTMCSGAAFWGGIGRVVYGMSNRRLLEFTGGNPQQAGYALPCREILLHGYRPVTVVGPLLEDEAALAHEGYWRR